MWTAYSHLRSRRTIATLRLEENGAKLKLGTLSFFGTVLPPLEVKLNALRLIPDPEAAKKGDYAFDLLESRPPPQPPLKRRYALELNKGEVLSAQGMQRVLYKR